MKVFKKGCLRFKVKIFVVIKKNVREEIGEETLNVGRVFYYCLKRNGNSYGVLVIIMKGKKERQVKKVNKGL